ncbi:MAG: trigger factor family protein [Bacteroidales bacterium]|jgi:trigger factor|nr:trigger factor family protein [Bacteroidales bacterium]
MNVSKEQIDNLTVEICVAINQADYQPEVDAEIKKYRKEAKMPGFRAGQVPVGMIKRMYEKSLRAEQIQKKINEGLYGLIDNEKLKILGEPLPIDNKNEKQSLEEAGDYKFYFEVGLQPDVELKLNSIKPKYYTVEPDEDILERFVEDICRRFGKYEQPDTIGDNDVVFGEMRICDENGTAKEDTEKINSSFAVDKIADAEIKKQIVGVKVGDNVTFNTQAAFKDDADRASMLRMDIEKAKEVKDVSFTPTNISRVTPAEMNEELFEKAYPKQNITTAEAFKDKAKQDLTAHYAKDADRFFFNEVVETLIKTTDVQLPDEFLKRWLAETAKDPATKVDAAANYEKHKDAIKWQIIEEKIAEQYNLKVDEQAIKEYFQSMLAANYFPVMEGESEEEKTKREQTIEQMTANLMANKEQTKQAFDFLYENQLIAVLKANINADKKTVGLNKFKEIVAEKNKP